MRFLCDEFRSTHVNEVGAYTPVSIEEFEITILSHFLNKPTWLVGAPREIARCWALDQILSRYISPKHNTFSILFTVLKQSVRRLLKLPVRLTEEQKDYFSLILSTFDNERSIKFVNDIEQMRYISTMIEYGIHLMMDEDTPIMIMPIRVNEKKYEDILDSIFIYNNEIVTGSDILSFGNMIENVRDNNIEELNEEN